MAIPVLFELNQELTRLFIAGSRLSSDDPRIKKFIPPLKKYGEKAPVFLKLAQHVEELAAVSANESAQKLIETEKFLLSVLSTQGDTSPQENDVLTDINYAQSENKLAKTAVTYRRLSPVIEALTTTGSGRLEIIQHAFENGLFADPRLYKAAVDALGDKYGEIADLAAEKILPSMGSGVCPFLLDGYNIKGGTSDGRRLTAMHKITGEKMLDLVDEAIEKGNAPVKTEAVKIMADYPRYEETLLGMLDESKTVREEVMKALVKMGSKKGVDKLIAAYKGSKPDTVLDALSWGTGEYLADEILQVAQADYEMIKKSDVTEKEIVKLKNDIAALKNKHTENIAGFFKTMLTEEYLVQAEAVLPKDKKNAYYYKTLEESALDALYHSGKGDDFIWEMFSDTQAGILNKIFKKSKKKDLPKTLNGYAFRIGSKTLDPDEFFNTFFKTDLYKDIAKNDYHAFYHCFLSEEEGVTKPAFSKKIARYFAENMGDHTHIDLAGKIVEPSDTGTLNILAEKLKNNLTKNVYMYCNYEILKKLGETGHKDFKELFELYKTKYRSSSENIDYLEQFLK